ncbi:MAG TPA: tetratricopeptide repeat protein, partial [Aggregatilineales bacterium]|nr:tetratricopeptide repeat protein [Aggregatilineales bacterium]
QREAGNAVGEALCLNTLGIIALDRQQFQLAQHYFELALKIAYAIDHKRHQTIFSGNLAEALHRLGDFDGAFAMYIQTLHRAYAIDNRKTVLNVLEQLANVELDRQHPQESARLLGMALALRES